MARLTDREIAERLKAAPGWAHQGSAIRKSYSFGTFAEAIGFVGRVAAAADAMDHHPDIDIRYTTVTMALSTHSAGGLTRKDFELAGKIDAAAR